MIPPSIFRTGSGDSWLQKTLKKGEYNVWFILILTGFGGPSVLTRSGIGAQVHIFVTLKLFNPVDYIYSLPIMEIMK